MLGERCWKQSGRGLLRLSLLLFLFAFISTANAEPDHGTRPPTDSGVSSVRESSSSSVSRPVAESEDPPATDASIPESVKLLAENVAKNRKLLIEELKRATTPEAKEEAAKALRKALGGDPEGKTLAPQELSDLVENLKKAEAATDKDTAAKALSDKLSPDGLGKELTPTVLHEAVKTLKSAATAESRETAAKDLLKTLGPDGLQVFNKNGTIDSEALATALTLDKTKEVDAFAAINEALKQRIEVTPGPLQDGNPEVPATADTTVDDGAGGGNTENPAEGGNVDLSNLGEGDVGLGGDAAALNDEQVANEDINRDLEDRLRDAEDQLEDAQDRERNRDNNERARGAGNGNNEEQQQSPSSGGGGAPSGGGGGGGKAPPPMPVPPAPQPKELAAFQAPEPPKDGLDPKIAEALANAIPGSGAGKKWDPTEAILADVAANGAKQIEIAKMKSLTQEAMLLAGANPRGGKLTTTRTGGGGGYDKSLASRVSSVSRQKGGGKPRTYRRRDGASGPALVSNGRARTQAASFRTFTKPGGSAKRGAPRRKGRSIR